eukprot:1742003-Prorocentrum_lima.AAC.1
MTSSLVGSEMCIRDSFMVGQGKRRCDPSKVQALRDWPDPRGHEDLASFLAYANYLCEFIPKLQELAGTIRPYSLPRS